MNKVSASSTTQFLYLTGGMKKKSRRLGYQEAESSMRFKRIPLPLKFNKKMLTECSLIYEVKFFNTLGLRDLKMFMFFIVFETQIIWIVILNMY